ncbi:g2041 [Coccomyxa elongata]
MTSLRAGHNRARDEDGHYLRHWPRTHSDVERCEGLGEGKTRRAILLENTAATLVAAGAWLHTSQPAQAIREVQLPDGSTVFAYELDVDLKIVALRGSVPSDAILDFRRALSKYGRFQLAQKPQTADIFEELGQPSKKNSAARADAVSLGDAWLGPAIRAGLIQPIPDAESSRWWGNLPPRWQKLVKRGLDGSLDPKGPVWACPHRWGCTLIAYRKSSLLRAGGRPIRDWGDLLQPCLWQRVAWVDSPREFVGAALKSLGARFNTRAADLASAGISEADLAERVDRLRQQVRVFSSKEHVKALGAKDVWAVVGWSGDLVQAAERSGDLVLVAPSSGTALWADMWAVPAHSEHGSRMEGPSPLLPAWLVYWVQPSRAAWNRGLKSGASPLLLPPSENAHLANRHEQTASEPDGASTGLQDMFGDVLPDEAVLQRSEFLLPLDERTRRLYWSVLHPDWDKAAV